MARDNTGQYLLADVMKTERFDAIFAVPGRPLTKTEEALAEEGLLRWIGHEAVAVQEALGVAAAGGKSAAMMKQVGLHAALDMVAISALVRTGGAMVIVVGDDPGSVWSDTEGDSRVLSRFCEVPCFEPAGPEDLVQSMSDAVALSAQLHTAVVLRMTTPMLMGRETELYGTSRTVGMQLKPFDPTSSFTTNSLGRRKRLHADLFALSDDGTTARRRAGDGSIRVIACGEPAIAAEIAGNVDLLVVRRVNPAPQEKIAEFLAEGGPVLVLENGQPHLEDVARGLAPKSVEILGRYTNHVPWAGNFEAADSLAAVASGKTVPAEPAVFFDWDDNVDLSVYGSLIDDVVKLGLAPASSDAGMAAGAGYIKGNPAPLCYGWGSPIGVAAGYAKLTGKPAVAVAGDGGMWHSGVVGMIQAVRDQSPVIICVGDDGAHTYTGGQPNPGSDAGLGQQRLILTDMARGLGIRHIEVVKAKNAKSDVLRPILQRFAALKEPSLLVIEKR